MSIEKLYEIYQAHPVVTTDSRKCPEGSMFFALKGANFDGNQYAAKALEAGCSVAVVDNPAIIPEGDDRYLLVSDVLSALQGLAAQHRRHFQGPVLQVTGTNGKTTTKELLAAVLSKKYQVLYTQGNLNNHIGVPLTLLRLRPNEHDMAIIETGANHPGEIAFLSNLVNPTCGLITNVGRAHLEGFGSFEGVKRTKGELYDYLANKPEAKIFVNADSPDLMEMLQLRGYHCEDDSTLQSYCSDIDTQSRKSTVMGCIDEQTPFLKVRWHDNTSEVEYVAQTQLIGDYNLYNILAAICVGTFFRVSPSDINDALEAYHPSLGRSEYRRTESNELIVDAYNANPTSMHAALANFKGISHAHKQVILGDMGELGADSEKAHQRIVEEVLQSNLDEAWLVGPRFAQALTTVPTSSKLRIRTFQNVGEVKEFLHTEQPKGKYILVKGSNSTHLYELPDLL